MRVLMVTLPLPTVEQPNTMAPLAYQIESLRAIGIDVEVLEITGASKIKYLKALPSFRKLVAEVDLVHAHFGYSAWLARCQFSKPLVVSFMGDDLLGTPNANGEVSLLSKAVVQIDRWLAKAVDAIIVKSAEMARVIEPLEARVIPNGIDLAKFKPMSRSKACKHLGWSEDKCYVLFPGDPENPRKGFKLAKTAVARASELMQQSLQLIPLKGVTPDLVPLYMNACQAMVMTSFIEGSPNVVKEAMACNLPVVSVHVGDTPELLDGIPGYTLCERDVDEFSQALVQTLESNESAQGRAALCAKGLDLESVARRLIDVYDNVLLRSQCQAIAAKTAYSTA